MKVSVIIPTYNREKTIKNCINSVISQTVAPFEIIVVDDGSTDDTINLLDGMDANIKVIKQNHKGAQAARNLGILNAKGDYIAFLDSDDEWLPFMLEVEIGEVLKHNHNCVIYSDCYACKGNRKKIWRLPEYGKEPYSSLLLNPGPMFQSILVKREMLIDVGLLDEKAVSYQEWDTAIRLAKKAKFVHIRKPLFIYNIYDGDTISNNKYRGIIGYKYVVRKYRKDIIKLLGLRGLMIHSKRLLKMYNEYLITKYN